MVKVIPVDFDDCDLNGAASLLETEVDKVREQYPGATIQIIGPLHLNYSLPDMDSAHRDFHYSETGVLIYVQEAKGQ